MAHCKLCNVEKPLIKKSHILPEFLFKKLFDPHHKLRKFDLIQMAKGNPRISRPSSGIYEGELLCQDCDNRVLGQYETYMSNVLTNNFKKDDKITCSKVKNTDGLIFIEVENLNYKKTKNFLLSILYRAHISNSAEFKNIDLGKYGEIIRDIIYNEKDTEEEEFQISVMKFAEGSNYSSFIGQLQKRQIDATTMYSIIINGYLIMFFTRQNGISRKTSNVRLQKSNRLSIIEIPDNLVEKFVLSYTGIK